MTEFNTPQLKDLLSNACKSHSIQDWNLVLQNSSLWQLRHDKKGHSVCFMSAKSLERAIIEDLLFTFSLKRKGAYGVYPHKQSYTHLGSSYKSQTPRIQFAIGNMIDRRLIVKNHLSQENWPSDATIQYELELNIEKQNEIQDVLGDVVLDINKDGVGFLETLITVNDTSFIGNIINQIFESFEND